MNKIYIGWDPRESAAYDLARWSFKERCKTPEELEINPLKLSDIKHVFNRPIEWKGSQMWCPISQAPQSTEFATSRFAIPFLSKGWVLFVDCDIICKADVNELFSLADDKYAAMVIKHKQKVDKDEVKMVDQASVYYNRKNWSSVMLINCDHPGHQRLTLDDLNAWPGRDLHAFKWLKDEEIGELPQEWNYLVDVNDPDLKSNAKIMHYTLGGPWLKGWQPRKSDEDWNKLYERFLEI